MPLFDIFEFPSHFSSKMAEECKHCYALKYRIIFMECYMEKTLGNSKFGFYEIKVRYEYSPEDAQVELAQILFFKHTSLNNQY